MPKFDIISRMSLLMAIVLAAAAAAQGTADAASTNAPASAGAASTNAVDLAKAASTNALALAKAKAAKAGRQGSAKITSASTYYDRKAGFAYFSGSVFVEDDKYQLHADRAYVFMEGTNELKRIVAIGHVAMTNDVRRAYGAKASYYRDPGMVVLYSGDGASAEVREERPEGPRVVRGKKIKFWTESEQVEVLEAEISSPSRGGLGELKGKIGK